MGRKKKEEGKRSEGQYKVAAFPSPSLAFSSLGERTAVEVMLAL